MSRLTVNNYTCTYAAMITNCRLRAKIDHQAGPPNYCSEIVVPYKPD